MPQYINDVNGSINLGGVVKKFSNVTVSGGDLVRYDSTPVGGPPSFNTYKDVRDAIEVSFTIPIPGNTPQAADDYVQKFAGANVFECVETPTAPNQIRIAGAPDMLGRKFIVASTPTPTYNFQDNAELQVTLVENGEIGED